ncbi:MAG: dihydrofolate reductase [Chloroflexi bacterium]|uniref:Dihydrofolate reductase n=1 Tax=Candidatus Chlorohelix allophototropha TaxID=3003348 RepID=A0A8T7LVL1_9CHLR|nr:dihydrofolate reductase [Chloroflexota bacterium]WJW67924.1 dihydrofolate reductase family protein [Chloroflexota bacterium L227-S17]
MRKINVFMMVTLDGFFAGSNGEIDWHVTDDEFNDYAIEQLNAVDLLLFGRKTYELMVSYWPTPIAIDDDPIVAAKMNSLPKIVFSKTLEKVDWHNTRLVKDNISTEIQRLKQQPGSDLTIMGSSDLSAYFINQGLLDEFRLMVNPVVLGRGKALFNGIKEELKLKLMKSRTFSSGNVLNYYRLADKE